MFGIWKRRRTEVLKYCHLVQPGLEAISSEFYDAIEFDLKTQELSGLEITRIDYAEGGLFSAKREYLRMRRERLVFDVCSAPFGTAWLFSYRMALIPAEMRNWEKVVLLLALAIIVWFYASLFGLILGAILFAASLLSLLLVMRNTVAMGLQDLDAALLQIPIIGAFYESYVRKETYYREDTRNAYMEIVEKVIQSRVQEVMSAGGFKLVEFKDATPPSHPHLLGMIAGLLRLAR